MANNQRARERVARWGLKVECVLCDWGGRHRPEKEGRLHLRRCACCGNRSLRMSDWVKRNPGEVEKARRELIEKAKQMPLLDDLSDSLRFPHAGRVLADAVDAEIRRRGLGPAFGER